MLNEIMDIELEEQPISNTRKASDQKVLFAEPNGLSPAAGNSGTGLASISHEMAAANDAEHLSIANSYVLAAVGDIGFRNNARIKTISLPNDLKVIPRSFFYECTNLCTITIPAEVQVIEDYAFYGCKNLKTVRFMKNSNLQKIGDYAFAACESLSAISLPEHLGYIGEAAFRCCKSISKVYIENSDSLRYMNKHVFIGNHAFQHCSALSEFVLPFGLDEVRTGLFFGCSALLELHIPATVNLVDNYVFQDCVNLECLFFASGKTKLMPLSLSGLPKDVHICLQDGREYTLGSITARLQKQKRGETSMAICTLLGRAAKIWTA
mgnify:CR=1 FL=1